ncbi:MAG: hypothetical protein QNL68_07250, partial [Akkermansiaceae bacterium]
MRGALYHDSFHDSFGVINPLSPLSAPVQRRFQNPPAKSKFLAALHYADASTSPLDAGSLVWSAQSGPINIDTAGLATGQVVFQDTGAVA